MNNNNNNDYGNWNTFASTGKIEDYLNYKGIHKNTASNGSEHRKNADNNRRDSNQGTDSRGNGQVY